MSRFQMVRFCLASAVGGMIVGYVGGSYPRGWTMSNLVRVVSLFGSILVIVVLLLLFGLAFAKSKASGVGKGVAANVFAIVALVAAVASVVLAMDWLLVDSIRPTTGFWSYLPHGNLFVAGGRDGWVGVSLVTLLVIVIFGEKIVDNLMVYLGFRLPGYKTGARTRAKTKDDPPKEDAQTAGLYSSSH